MIPMKNTNMNNNEKKQNNMPSANSAGVGVGGSEKAQGYATIVYLDSAPDEWQHVLNDTHVRALISPLHDRDTLPDQSFKKPHYHVMVIFDRASSKKRAQKIFESIGGVGCEPIASIVGYARYLIHLDDPDKAQYDISDVVALSGADYESIIALPDDKWQTLSDIIDYIFTHHITSYSTLVAVCKNNNRAWLKLILGRNAYAINSLLRSYECDMIIDRRCNNEIDNKIQSEIAHEIYSETEKNEMNSQEEKPND